MIHNHKSKINITDETSLRNIIYDEIKKEITGLQGQAKSITVSIFLMNYQSINILSSKHF